jgi:transcriptional regulator with XRE-family HTH domain
MDPEWFAGRLRELRQEAGLSRADLAAKVGGDTSERTIENYETGHRKPSWEMVLKLCGALGVECSEFTKEPKTRGLPGVGRPKKRTEDEPAAAKSRRKGRA